jgi:hypothetical protein
VNRILWNPGREVIDEIVIHDCTVHIEQMSDDAWWIGIDLADGSYWEGNFWTLGSTGSMVFTEQESDVEWDRDEVHK